MRCSSNFENLPACCGLCCLGEFMSGGSSLNETDFSNETDLSIKITHTKITLDDVLNEGYMITRHSQKMVRNVKRWMNWAFHRRS